MHGTWLPEQTDDDGKPTGKRDQGAVHIDLGIPLQDSTSRNAAEARRLRGCSVQSCEIAGEHYTRRLVLLCFM